MRRAVCLFSLLLPGPLFADAVRDDKEVLAFFAVDRVVRLEITIDAKDFEALCRAPRQYVPCQLKADGKPAGTDVAVKVKGGMAGSFEPVDRKPALTLNMDKLKKKQRFHGMDKWHLSNGKEDPSYLNELISGELMRAAGVPASRIRLALVTINGKPRGMYYIKEGYDK